MNLEILKALLKYKKDGSRCCHLFYITQIYKKNLLKLTQILCQIN